jgi:hypothetical protein
MARKLKGSFMDAATSPTMSILTVLGLIIVIIALSFGYLYFSDRLHKHDEAQEENSQKNKICMTLTDYEKLKYPVASATASNIPPIQQATATTQSPQRDYRVLNDPLYPPLNRTDTQTHQMLEKNIDARNMYVPTNDTMDNYRLVGYVVNKDQDKDAGGNNWKLFARQKDRNTADFYMVPANNNYDVKIHITDEMVKGDRLRDVYSLPNHITFSSPMLNSSPYEYVEIPKADLSSSSRYL